MLISPGLDVERTPFTSFLEKLQGIALKLCPSARIVPAVPFEQCTDVPDLVCCISYSSAQVHACIKFIPAVLVHTVCRYPHAIHSRYLKA